ncbi:Hpt domain-containing protein [Sphingomonas colocasiae]|jgi:HPt (histidine-containing phosphotransfer) domain-containing protein|uniref:Hpt domain-containing protein n=1 Tax=Sphingomonas colocasiae TaxID=1848973 RepID=A0ABS7PRC1_9SPHN|nr:Hpt domain-containing protein [Sphingomonas colocasiae]MBY8822962.1 Hpt domain-containing protein [Sphingomonas colocasiae]
MAYDPGALNTALAAAVGDDPSLIAELRAAFMDSALRQADLLSRARCDANWQMAAWRLKGLAASFGAVRLMDAAEAAATAAPGDPVAVRRVNSAISSFDR